MMLNVLIVDDDSSKMRGIASAVEAAAGIEGARIELAVDAITARRAMRKEQFDLLLLDLHLPNRLPDDPDVDGGVKLLQEIDRDPRIFTPFHVIAITAVPEAKVRAEKDLDSRLWAIIEFDAASEAWKSKIARKVAYLMSVVRSAKIVRPREHIIDLAIVTALREELNAIRALPANWQEVRFPLDPTLYYEGMFKRDDISLRVVCASADRMGMSASAVLSTKVIEHYQPRYLCMGGVAAGVAKRTNIGDVLVADPSWDWGSGKFEVVRGKGQFSADPIQLDLDPGLRARIQSALSDTGWLQLIKHSFPGTRPSHDLNVHVESVASGAAVIADSAVVDKIRQGNRKLHGVEMEIFGVMCAAANCSGPKPLAFSAKSVCDFADAEKGDSERIYANYTSANFIYELALRHLSVDLRHL